MRAKARIDDGLRRESIGRRERLDQIPLPRTKTPRRFENSRNPSIPGGP
jgi:hypothetical protein